MTKERVGLENDNAGMQGQAFLDRRLLAWLCATELLMLGAICTLYRGAGKPDLSVFLLSRPGGLFSVLVAGFGLTIGGAVFHVLRQGRLQWKRCGWTLGCNVVAFVGVLGLGEVVVRALTVDTLRGPRIAGLGLRPFVWKEIAERFAKKAEEQQWEQFHSFDPVLGWTVRPNSTGERGLFKSSAEGIRSSRVGIEYASTNPACRIALIGDSFVFGEESEFEKSWGHQLELSLSNRCQVLNFGVGGYGLGQMYLRYNRDVSPFHPNVVIVGFTDGVVYRTFGVYGFLTFDPGYVPGPFPRYVFEDGRLKLINVPLIHTKAIYSSQTVHDLPYIRYALEYQPTEWEMPGWRMLSWSYMFRMYATFFPLYSEERPEISFQKLHTVNGALFRRLADDIRADGGVPLFVYFPSDKQNNSAPVTRLPRSLEILRESGLPYFSLAGCLNQVDPDRRFLKKGDHYSEEGDSAVAQCLKPIVKDLLEGVSR